ncbi:hypothetical protein HPC49_04765 [Pyxidicoccus fallax]|uniref:Lipoprotein n=1 Tax=Pyxidicoccus fallax TaxID=394095 RepID=A0A848LEX7_9BACT|nr:hypothetical protein [Pyxidicoccus fallax]NMO16822.1 hypothetical protein [Pyxidicoccus fallax]NPC77563.1 hypothetical protein [Pyxidicoccus fallax]
MELKTSSIVHFSARILRKVTKAFVAGLLLVATEAAANCWNYPLDNWVLVRWSGDWTFYERYEFFLVSSTPTFNVSDSRIAVNDLGTPISVTFTAQRSETFSVSVTAGMSAKLGEFLTANVSSTIVMSQTTQVGVSTTATVPPYSRVRGDYGVTAFDVTYDVRTLKKTRLRQDFGSSTFCSDAGIQRQTINAPTYVEGWRVGPG